MKVISVGLFPPPYGGVSNHIKRLHEFLLAAHEESVVFDTSDVRKQDARVSKWNAIRFLLSTMGQKHRCVVHSHQLSTRYFFWLYLISFRHVIIVSFHNLRFLDDLNRLGNLKRKAYVFLVNRFDAAIVDSQGCRALASLIIRDQDKIRLIPEFIPPARIPELRIEWIQEMRRRYKYILSSNAFEISFHQGTDTYGIDLLIELVRHLYHANELDVGMVFLLPRIGDEEYFASMLRKIEESKINDRFKFITEPIEESSSVWKISDLVLRATNTDGNSLTIHEALNVGTPVIASDCVERPEEVILFKNRDIHDLERKTLDALINLEFRKARVRSAKVKNNAGEFFTLYSNLLARN